MMDGDILLSQIVESLVAHIPSRVETIGIHEPVYCLRIWYFGTDVDGDRTPSLTLKTDALRKIIVAEKAELAPTYVWGADEYEVGEGVFNVQIENASITRLCAEWFKQLPNRELPDDNDLIPLRKTIQGVAKVLNGINWKQFVNCTDDFVVFAADGSHSFCNDFEEMIASVAPARIDDFRSRSLVGPIKWWTLSPDATT